jgi:hypothetical protein
MSAYGNTSSFAFHDGIFSTEPWALGLTTVLVILVAALASLSGVGGGGIVVPIIAFLLGTGVKFASPISSTAIMGAAVGKNIVSLMRRHPVLVRPLIHFDLAVLLETMLTLGTIIGVVLFTILPEVAIVIILLLVLGYSGVDALLSGLRKYREEDAVLKVSAKGGVAGFQDQSKQQPPPPPSPSVELATLGADTTKGADLELQLQAQAQPTCVEGSARLNVDQCAAQKNPKAFTLDGVDFHPDRQQDLVGFLKQLASPASTGEGNDAKSVPKNVG